MLRFFLVLPLAVVMAAGCAHKKAHNRDDDELAGRTGKDSGKLDCSSLRVHFAYDSSDLSNAEKSVLEQKAECIKTKPKMVVTIEGNTDERGTEEYNLALGERRAGAVSEFLLRMGTEPVQLKTVSWGEEKPLCDDANEHCYTKNRRAWVNLDGAKSKGD